MKAKTMIGMAVASALSWSYGAMADGAYGHMGSQSTYGVATPFSPNEAGPAALPHGDRYASMGVEHTSAGIPAAEIETPLASNEAGMHEPVHAASMRDRRGHGHMASRTSSFHRGGMDHHAALDAPRTSGSLPNPQTPWYSFEGGLNTYAEDMQHYRRQTAEVEQARIAASEWNARIAASDSTELERSSALGIAEPVGGTSGIGTHGSLGSSASPHATVNEPASSDFRSEAADTPSEVERTSWMRSEAEQPVTVTEYSAVGILEMPDAPSEHTVWNVEPLTPNADLAAGDTVYVVPDGADLAGFTPEFDRSGALDSRGEQSASTGESAEERTSGSSL